MSILRLLAHAEKLCPSSFFPIFGIVLCLSWVVTGGGRLLLFLLGRPSPPCSLGGGGGPLSPLSLGGGEGSSPSGFGLGEVVGGSTGFLPSRLDPVAPLAPAPLISGVFKRWSIFHGLGRGVSPVGYLPGYLCALGVYGGGLPLIYNL